MKTKLFALLTGLTTLTTVVAGTAPAQATDVDALMKAFFEFAPTQDGQKINEEAKLSGITEVDITGLLTVNQSTSKLEAVFLGEFAGSTKNVLGFSSSNGASGTMWSEIQAHPYRYDPETGEKLPEYKVGNFDQSLNSKWGLGIGSTLSLGAFEAGSTLDFTLKNTDFSANYGFSMSSQPGQFKGYTLAGFEDWLVIGIEDTIDVIHEGKYIIKSDWDYNDTVFAVKLGTPAASVPEPSTIAALMGVSAAVGFSRRKNANKS
ncbi:MAG: PEP-CTERM sorting domain-containing protein [Lyngbya sp.]|nr:PEP-CTERM sorting domain-containing protein [Lyngbya sp.]